MANPADFSDLGAVAVTTPHMGIDFSDLGGVPVAGSRSKVSKPAAEPLKGFDPALTRIGENLSKAPEPQMTAPPLEIGNYAQAQGIQPSGDTQAFNRTVLNALPLATAKKYLVDPFEAMAKAGGEFGREMAKPTPYDPYLAAKVGILVPQHVSPTEEGVHEAVGEVLGSTLADPRQLPFLVEAGAGNLAKGFGGKAISTGFAALMGQGANEEAKRFGAVMDQPGEEAQRERARAGTAAVLDTLFAGFAGGHAVDFTDLGAKPVTAEARPGSGEPVKAPTADIPSQPKAVEAPRSAVQPRTSSAVAEVPTSELQVDPHRFQYKLGTDAEGVSTLLKDQDRFNPDLAGVISVWRDPSDGLTYVVNGHHRFELAKRTGAPEVAVRYIEAPDADTARQIGALQNIAEGRGTPVDAAKFIRDSGYSLDDLKAEGISLGEATARKGLALSRLDDSPFNKVVQGDLREGRAVAIGEATPDHAEQRAILDLVTAQEKRGKRVSDETLRELVRFVQGTGQTHETTASLFGEQHIARSYALEKAEVSAYIKEQLARDRKLFGFVAKGERASRLAEEKAGQIDVERSREISSGAAQAEEIYNRLSERAGPVAQVLEDSARRVAEGENANAVKQQAYAKIRQAVSETLSGREAAGFAPTEGDAGQRPTALQEPRLPQPGTRFGQAEEAPVEPLPGFERTLQEHKRAATEEQGRQLSAELLQPQDSISRISGEMERNSPLFRDTEASGQSGLFSQNPPGPGAKNVGPNEVPGTSLTGLTESLTGKRLPEAGQVAPAGEIPKATKPAAPSLTAELWRRFTSPPKQSDFRSAVKRWQGADQVSDLELTRFAKTVKQAMPNKLRREAVTNWIQADGDANLLRERAAASDKRFAPGYQAALALTPDERVFANNVRNYFDAKLEEGRKAGLLEQGIENYVNQVWAERPDAEPAKRLLAAAVSQQLAPDPAFIRKRVLDSYFDGEQLGFAPKDKDIAALVAHYDQAFNRALASRAFIRELHNASGSDGRPLVEISGVGRAVPEGEAPEAILVTPRSKPGDAWDYKLVDHPALRGWKWATKDAEGKPVFVKGDMLVHPEYAGKLRALLEPSRVRQSALGRTALKVSSFLKGTMLSASPFHQTQLAVHALEHTVNPFRVPEIDLNNPVQRSLIDNGLMVADFHGWNEFAEGSYGSGLFGKIPVVRDITGKYQQYLFREYIPRLKMAMAEHAFERNIKRYPDLSREQVLELTAGQANAAFGHLNYKLLGRSATQQDWARLLLLAPDFLEARARFVGQGLKPYGREQSRALIYGALAQLAGKAIYEQLSGEKQDYSLAHLFRIKIGNREVSLRTVQGDLVELASDTGRFFAYRLNPLTTRPLLEALSGRDAFGRQRSRFEQLEDASKQVVPIPLKGLLYKNTYEGFRDSLLQSLGVQSRKYRQFNELHGKHKEKRK